MTTGGDRPYRARGVLECPSLDDCAARKGEPFIPALIALLFLVGQLAAFWGFIFPVNQATQNRTMLPENWPALRSHWEYAHAIRAILYVLACGTLVIYQCWTGDALTPRAAAADKNVRRHLNSASWNLPPAFCWIAMASKKPTKALVARGDGKLRCLDLKKGVFKLKRNERMELGKRCPPKH